VRDVIDAQAERRARFGWVRTAVVVCATAVALLTVVTARVFVWPDLQPLPVRADAVVELAGPGDDDRDRVALDLARDQKAPVLVQSTVVGDNACLPPVAGVRLVCFHPDPLTTRGEARYIAALAAREHWHSVILVATPDQAWRARLRVSRCFPGKVYVATAHLPTGDWLRQIPYQWVASAKALTIQRSC
jgi:hypothetical protein